MRCSKCGALYAYVSDSARRCVIAEDSGNVCGGMIVDEEPKRVPPAIAEYLGMTGPLPEMLRAVLQRSTMRRRHGGAYPGGEVEAIITFANSEDRATFANWVVASGGKVTG